MPKFKSKDFVAILMILVYMVLKSQGFDGTIDAALGVILGYYFVKRTNGADNGN